MGKACAVLKCIGGSKADRRWRKEHGVRQISLFKSPKSPSKRAQWSHILDYHLHGSEFVCERHFLDKDIRKVDRVLLSDGTEHIMPRIHWSLNPNALPIPVGIEMLNGNDNNSPDDGADRSAGHEDVIPSELSATCEESTPINDRGRFGINDDCGQPRGDSSEILFAVQRSGEMPVTDRNGTHEAPPIVDDENTKLAAQPQILSILTLDFMKNQLKDMILPEAWSWLQRPTSVMFTYHDRWTFEALIHLEIGDDLSATICTSGGQRIPMDAVTSMSDMRPSFRVIEKLPVCNGTGMERKRRAPNCIGILNEKQYKRGRPILRCHYCRDLRRKLQNRTYYTDLMTEPINARARRKLSLVRKQCSRLRNKDSMAVAKGSRKQWLNEIDRLLENGDCDENLPVIKCSDDHQYAASLVIRQTSLEDPRDDHCYDVTRTSDEVQSYISRYIVRAMVRHLTCTDCIKFLQSRNPDPGDSRHAMIELMDKHKGLLYPSDDLFSLTKIIEQTVLDAVGKFEVKMNTMNMILDKLLKIKQLPMVGCDKHKNVTTRKIIDFYLVMRGHFISKAYNANNDAKLQKTREHRKLVKL